MPDALEVRRACDRAVRKLGFDGLTRRAVIAELNANRKVVGSATDLGPMIRAYKEEFQDAPDLPDAVRQRIAEFAQEIWKAGYMAALSAPQNFPPILSSGLGAVEPSPSTSSSPSKPGKKLMNKTERLAQAVEIMFHKGQTGKAHIAKPLTAAELWRILPPEVKAKHYKHLSRDLLRSNSTLIYRMSDNRFWRRDRDDELVGLESENKGRKPYKPTGTPLSLLRQQNELVYEQAIAHMNEVGRPLSKDEIAAALNISDRDKKAFYDLLRNRIRADGRIRRDAESKYSAVNKE